MTDEIKKFDCEECGAKESVYCVDVDKGIYCQSCGAYYGNPYTPESQDPEDYPSHIPTLIVLEDGSSFRETPGIRKALEEN
jgi:transcription elongation factor Elf1